jgi:dihydrofolate reductase
MDFHIIAACDFNGSIGKDGAIPWDIPEDMTHFRELTTFHPGAHSDGKANAVIMGRLTWESLPHGKLRDRHNIVISNTLDALDLRQQGVHVCKSLNSALHLCKQMRHIIGYTFVIGGGKLYREAIRHPHACKVFLTCVHDRIPGCDATFPLKLLTDFYNEEDDAYSGLQFSKRRPEAPPYSFHVWRNAEKYTALNTKYKSTLRS